MIALLRVLLPLLFCSLVWAAKGDSKCSSVMCVTAYANETEVTYTLQAKTAVDGLGWMAIGFGNRMANTPMVIVWPSSSASNGFVISQRQASGTVQPSVVASPPRVATPFAGLTTQDSSSVTYAFTVPAGEGTTQELIWAYSTERPSSDAVGASLQQHDERGRFTLNLANDLESETPATTAPSDDEGSTGLTRNQQILAAHAVIATIGFLVILPAGALLARLGRTFTSSWFKGHWILQWVIGGLFIGVGWILGVAGVAQNNKPHFDTTHKVLGLILLMVYIAQLALGGVIHFFKTPTRTKRPPQNYMHAIIGLLIIALSMFQVHEGFQEEWPRATGRGKFGNGLYIFWVIWVVLLTLLYFGGLALLKRQFAQEAESLREKQRKMEKNSSV